MFNNSYMEQALKLAMQAASNSEVPVGAIIVSESGEILGQGANTVEATNDITNHAEIIAIKQALSSTKNSSRNKLSGCTIYVTLEPCGMCAVAISHAKISKLVYAASDKKFGAVEHGACVYNHATCHHKPEVISGIMSEQSKNLLKDFFKKLR